ncbi:hypothetical protein RP726_05855 [Candidatus Methylospira mobilis]|nr:hypothetical protein [Candidatus Methylospira mobilis]WNV05937.1 hypothetical protein RP726_05855 [Candidatus Methylospira mobilis]
MDNIVLGYRAIELSSALHAPEDVDTLGQKGIKFLTRRKKSLSLQW